MTEVRVTEQEFQLLRRLVYKQTGIALGESKRALLEARLRGRLRELGLFSFLGYHRYLCQCDAKTEELQRLVDCITTNTTSFFREYGHFLFLAEEVLPTWQQRTAQQKIARLRLWSAGCSTGQEAYSLAAVVHSVLPPLAHFDAKILATDISSRALAVAAAARYPLGAANIPPAWRGSFLSEGVGEQRHLKVNPSVRERVVVRALNLLAPRYPFHGRFAVIFCRNVLIYFDAATRRTLIERLCRCLLPGGYLFLGMSEGLQELPPGMTSVGPAIYRLCETDRTRQGWWKNG